jgi:anti-sigma B factor antagonist
MSQESLNTFSLQEIKQGVVSLTLGESVLGGNDALNFSSKLMELNQKNTKHVIIDLQNVKMINSSGIGMLVSGLTTLKKNDASLILVGLSDKIKGLLKMTHLDQVFITNENVDEAIESIK